MIRYIKKICSAEKHKSKLFQLQKYSLDDLSSQPALVSLFAETVVKPQLPPCLIELDYVYSVFQITSPSSYLILLDICMNINGMQTQQKILTYTCEVQSREPSFDDVVT